MFENKFNSKKADPLVEAAKAAMELGQKRREAIAAVNEEFGVFNRNAVVRENLAKYDARIEEVFNGMKSGNLTEELSPKQKKMAAVAGNPKKIDAADLKALRHGAKIDEKKGCYEEGNDGNLANNYPPYDKVTRGDVIAGATGKDQMGGKRKVNEKKGCYEEGMDSDVVGGGSVTKDNKPVVSSTAPKVNTSGPSAADKAGLAAKIGAMKEAKLYELKAPTGKTARQVMDRAERRDDEEGDWTRSNRIYKSMKRRYPGKSARNQKDTGKADLPDVGNIEFHKAGYSGHVTKGGKLTKAASRDTKDGIKSRLGKHTKPHLPEETIEEAVSRKHFQQVADLIKGHESQEKRNELASHHAGIFAKQNPRFDHGRFHKAAGSTAHEAPAEKKMEEAAYSAKAAREGKDIGKPGKSFKMIAKKAGEKYGSEERGKKVAGAILAKIRAKHMKEDNLEEMVVQKSQMRPGETLGQTMNRLQGKTAIKGGKNDPSSPNFAGPKPASTPTPSASTPAPTKWADAGAKERETTAATTASQNASLPKVASSQDKLAADAAQVAKAAPVTSPVSGPGPSAVASKPASLPSMATSDSKAQVASTPAPAADKKREAGSLPTMAESLNEGIVSVGANKYRIV
jgi:hypothetical protein